MVSEPGPVRPKVKKEKEDEVVYMGTGTGKTESSAIVLSSDESGSEE